MVKRDEPIQPVHTVCDMSIRQYLECAMSMRHEMANSTICQIDIYKQPSN